MGASWGLAVVVAFVVVITGCAGDSTTEPQHDEQTSATTTHVAAPIETTSTTEATDTTIPIRVEISGVIRRPRGLDQFSGNIDVVAEASSCTGPWGVVVHPRVRVVDE